MFIYVHATGRSIITNAPDAVVANCELPSAVDSKFAITMHAAVLLCQGSVNIELDNKMDLENWL